MMRSAIRSGLVTVCFSLWAGFCAATTTAVVVALSSRDRRDAFEGLIQLLPYSALTAVVAGLGWAALHFRNRQPGPGAYIALAIGIVVVVHLALVYENLTSAESLFGIAFLSFLFHYWFTLPIAVGATGLFVWCLKRGWRR